MVYAIRGLATTQAKQVVASCVNTDSCLDKITRKSGHKWDLRHLLQNKLAPWASKTFSTKQILPRKEELLSSFCNNFSQLAMT